MGWVHPSWMIYCSFPCCNKAAMLKNKQLRKLSPFLPPWFAGNWFFHHSSFFIPLYAADYTWVLIIDLLIIECSCRKSPNALDNQPLKTLNNQQSIKSTIKYSLHLVLWESLSASVIYDWSFLILPYSCRHYLSIEYWFIDYWVLFAGPIGKRVRKRIWETLSLRVSNRWNCLRSIPQEVC